jgi:hypothetical protein
MRKTLLVACSLAVSFVARTASASNHVQMHASLCDEAVASFYSEGTEFVAEAFCPLLRLRNVVSPNVLYSDLDMITSATVSQSEVSLLEYDDDGSFEATSSPTTTSCYSGTRHCHDWSNETAVLVTSSFYLVVEGFHEYVYYYSFNDAAATW